MKKPFEAEKKGLNIIIVGCGKVGATLVEQLNNEGHDITVIDKRPEKVAELTNIYDIMGLVGNGASYEILEEAGIENCDVLVAVTGTDELNLLCCTMAKRTSKCETIARIISPDYNNESSFLRKSLGISLIINSDLRAAREMAHIIYMPTSLEAYSFSHGLGDIVKFKVPKGNLLDGLRLSELNKKVNIDVLICVVERNGEIIIPNGDFIMKADDIFLFITTKKNVNTFAEKLGFDSKKVQDVMIVGGGKTTYYLAKILDLMKIKTKIIEADKNRCEFLSSNLPKATIICGDGTDDELLREEGLETTSAFIPITGIDEENIMLSLHARKFSKAKVITKVNRSTFKSVINTLDLDSVIFPRYITCETIIAYIRAKKASLNSSIETLYHMFDNQVEAVEFVATDKSKVTDIPLMDLNLKDSLLIACIIRKGDFILPTGRDTIQVGDKIMIISTHTGLKEIDEILK